MNIHKFTGRCILILVILFAASCSHPNIIVKTKGDIKEIKRIAVLPLDNLTSERYASENIRSILIASLLNRGFDVVEIGEVVRVLNERRVFSVKDLTTEKIKKIGFDLAVDGIMTGSVSRYTITKGVSVSYPEVTVTLMLFDAKTGKLVWNAWATEGGPSLKVKYLGTEMPTINETAMKVINKMLDNLDNFLNKE